MKNLKQLSNPIPFSFNLDLTMKLTICLLLNMFFQVQASDNPNNTNISLHLDNVTVERVLKEIEKRSEYKFLYNNREVNYKRLLSVSYSDESVPSILVKIFQSTTITFEIMDKQIILRPDSSKTPGKVPTVGANRAGKVQMTVTGSIIDTEGVPYSGGFRIGKEYY